MPYYKITGMLSERHPFYGCDGCMGADPVASTKLDILAPTISGAILATVAYSTAKSFGIDSKKSLGVGVTMGIITAIGQIAGGWLRNKAAAAVAPVATVTPPTATVAAK